MTTTQFPHHVQQHLLALKAKITRAESDLGMALARELGLYPDGRTELFPFPRKSFTRIPTWEDHDTVVALMRGKGHNQLARYSFKTGRCDYPVELLAPETPKETV